MEDSPSDAEKSGTSIKPDNDEKEESEATCGVDRDLVVPKLSFFFFYMALGSVLPYLGVYYKQLWLNARESGILLGIRPFIKMLCSPVWGVLTDYFHKPKFILLLSIFCSMLAYWSQSIVSPFELPCYVRNNTNEKSGNIVPIMSRSISRTNRINWAEENTPNLHLSQELNFEKLLDETSSKTSKANSLKKRLSDSEKLNESESNPEVSGKHYSEFNEDNSDLKSSYGSKSTWEDRPKDVDRELVKDGGDIYNELEGQSLSSSPFARTIMIKNKKVKSPKPDTDFRIRDNKKIYLTLLILIIFGEMVAAPAPMLTDSGTLTLLSGREHEYGRQRLFGAFGWGAGSLFAGAVVTAFHKCPYSDNINYVPVFYVFAVAMFINLIATSFFKFKSQDDSHHESESRAKKCIEGLMPFKNVKNAAFIFVLFFCGFLHR